MATKAFAESPVQKLRYRGEPSQLGMCHLDDQLMHRGERLPTENSPGFAGVTTQVDGIGGAQEVLFGAHVLLPIKSQTREGRLRNLSHRMRGPAGENKIISRRVIENHQKTSHHIARIAPVSTRLQIPQT